jgi:hypothetical protein
MSKASDKRLRKTILDAVSDSIMNFAYYDRKEDEDLSADALTDGLARGVVTPEEIADLWREAMRNP